MQAVMPQEQRVRVINPESVRKTASGEEYLISNYCICFSVHHMMASEQPEEQVDNEITTVGEARSVAVAAQLAYELQFARFVCRCIPRESKGENGGGMYQGKREKRRHH